MRILVVPAIDWFTALENRVHHLARCWAAQHEVHVVHLPLGGDPIRGSEGHVVHRLSTAKTRNLLSYYLINFIPQIVQMTRIIRREDIELLVTTNLSAGTAAILAARISGASAIFDYCDYLPAFSRYAGISALLQPLLRRVGELITVLNFRMADATVVTGHLLRRHAQEFSRDVLEIPNGVDGSRFAGVPKWEPSDRPALGYVGILDFFVDLRSAIEALRAMEGSKLIIAGDGRDRAKLAAFARGEGLEDRIEFLGKVAYDQLPRWMGSMDICLLPFVSSDLTESALPLKIHEYAASRRPVISTPLFEVVRMYGDLLTYAQGPVEISSKAGAILEERRATIRRIRRSYLRATVTYSWDRFGARYQEAFLRASGSRGEASSSGG